MFNNSYHKCLFFISSFIILIFNKGSFALPISFYVDKDFPLYLQSRSDFIAFNYENNNYKIIPFQIDELEDDTFLILRNPQTELNIRKQINKPKYIDPYKGKLSDSHRIVFNINDFNYCDEKCQSGINLFVKNLCQNDTDIIKMNLLDTNKTIFLANCYKQKNNIINSNLTKIDLSKLEIFNSIYKVILNNDHPFLLKDFKLYNDEKKVYENSIIKNITFKANLKKTVLLPSVSISHKDMKHFITATTINNISSIIELGMNNKIMGIGASEQVCCDISFYNDAFYFPVSISIPDFLGKLGANSYIDFNMMYNKNYKFSPSLTDKKFYLLWEQNNNYIGFTIKNKSQNTFLSSPKLQHLNETYQTNDKNISISINLENITGDVNFDLWFYISKNKEELLKLLLTENDKMLTYSIIK